MINLIRIFYNKIHNNSCWYKLIDLLQYKFVFPLMYSVKLILMQTSVKHKHALFVSCSAHLLTAGVKCNLFCFHIRLHSKASCHISNTPSKAFQQHVLNGTA